MAQHLDKVEPKTLTSLWGCNVTYKFKLGQIVRRKSDKRSDFVMGSFQEHGLNPDKLKVVHQIGSNLFFILGVDACWQAENFEPVVKQNIFFPV